MTIDFLCPNGHRIRCGDERAGLAAKCPKCGVKFRIPTVEELAASEPEVSVPDQPPPQPGGSSDAGVEPGIVAGAATAEDQIEFLCPNNHLLHGPLNLQGEVGRCPECQSKFRIPSYDELEEEIREEPAEPEPTPPPSLPPLRTSAGRRDEGLVSKPADSSSAVDLGDAGLPKPPGEAATLASLFRTLWAQRSKGATIEVRYGNDQSLTPVKFFPAMSGGTHAVFAESEAGGVSTLVVVAWSAVTSVVVRGVRKLPDGGVS